MYPLIATSFPKIFSVNFLFFSGVRSSVLACNGFEDDEIYSMAVHYYDEDDLEVGSRVACHVVVKRESRSPQAGDTAVSGPRAT